MIRTIEIKKGNKVYVFRESLANDLYEYRFSNANFQSKILDLQDENDLLAKEDQESPETKRKIQRLGTKIALAVVAAEKANAEFMTKNLIEVKNEKGKSVSIEDIKALNIPTSDIAEIVEAFTESLSKFKNEKGKPLKKK